MGEYNLHYADKDAKDIQQLFKQMEPYGFDKIHTKTLTNSEVTNEKYKEL